MEPTARASSTISRPTGHWKRVWVTALGPGGVRFQDETPKLDGCSYLDRTTLTPLTGRVRHVIEISRHGGKASQVTFGAEYRRPK